MKKQQSLFLAIFIFFIGFACNKNEQIVENNNPEILAKLFTRSEHFNNLMIARNSVLQEINRNGKTPTAELERLLNDFNKKSQIFESKFATKKLDKGLFTTSMIIAVESYNSAKARTEGGGSACIAEYSRCTSSAEEDFWGSWWTGLLTAGTGSVIAYVVYQADLSACNKSYESCQQATK